MHFQVRRRIRQSWPHSPHRSGRRKSCLVVVVDTADTGRRRFARSRRREPHFACRRPSCCPRTRAAAASSRTKVGYCNGFCTTGDTRSRIRIAAWHSSRSRTRVDNGWSSRFDPATACTTCASSVAPERIVAAARIADWPLRAVAAMRLRLLQRFPRRLLHLRRGPILRRSHCWPEPFATGCLHRRIGSDSRRCIDFRPTGCCPTNVAAAVGFAAAAARAASVVAASSSRTRPSCSPAPIGLHWRRWPKSRN